MNDPTCYGCECLADSFGNYVVCKKAAEDGTNMFVDWWYWNNGSPDECPLKIKTDEVSDKDIYVLGKKRGATLNQ